jgi:prephenate dehydratase
MKKEWWIGAVVVVVLVIAVGYALMRGSGNSQTGTLSTEPGQGQDTLFLDSGSKHIKLVMTASSTCAAGTAEAPCMAINSMYSAVFGGHKARVEGVQNADKSINVTRLTVLPQ